MTDSLSNARRLHDRTAVIYNNSGALMAKLPSRLVISNFSNRCLLEAEFGAYVDALRPEIRLAAFDRLERANAPGYGRREIARIHVQVDLVARSHNRRPVEEVVTHECPQSAGELISHFRPKVRDDHELVFDIYAGVRLHCINAVRSMSPLSPPLVIVVVPLMLMVVRLLPIAILANNPKDQRPRRSSVFSPISVPWNSLRVLK